jgi:hypothetical protein
MPLEKTWPDEEDDYTLRIEAVRVGRIRLERHGRMQGQYYWAANVRVEENDGFAASLDDAIEQIAQAFDRA